MMVKVQFEKGAVGTMHEHHHSQATYVVSGKFELTIGEQKERRFFTFEFNTFIRFTFYNTQSNAYALYRKT